MASHFATYLRRSVRRLVDNTTSVVKMGGADAPTRGPMLLYSLRSQEDLKEFVVGSDKDMGGASSAQLMLDEDSKGVFKGSLRATVMTAKNALGGYAALRTRNRPTFFGPLLSDITFHEFLALRCRVAGSPSTRNSYFVNLQTDEVAQSTEIWQHRLYFPKGDGKWEDVFIPLSNFICTNAGNIVEPDGSIDTPLTRPSPGPYMSRDRIRTIGISLLGTPETDGEFEFGLEEIKAVNKEDIYLPETELEAMVQTPAMPISESHNQESEKAPVV